MVKNIITAVLLFTACACVHAQVGGQRSYEFMNVPASALITSVGGVNVSLRNTDLNLVYNNPALASDTLSGFVSFNYLNYFAGSYALSFIYQHDLGKYGHWAIGARHFDYGSFESYDPGGASLGEVDASDNVIFISRAHTINSITLGATIKFINSDIAGFASNALAMDIGGSFQHPKKQLSAGLVVRNFGIVLSDYNPDSKSRLPFDVQIGASFKPQHMPLRFSFTGYNLYKGDIAYADIDQGDPEPGAFDKIFRHIAVGAELLLTKNVNLRFGYNHLIRQELKVDGASGGAGFSFGLMAKVKAFEFAYGRGGYHAAGGTHNFTLTANTNLFFKNQIN